MVSYESGSKGFLVERKSAADFRASIVDGRFAEQRSRLLQSGFDIVYIVEGDLRVVDAGRKRELYSNVLTAMLHLEARGYQVFRTYSIEENVRIAGPTCGPERQVPAGHATMLVGSGAPTETAGFETGSGSCAADSLYPDVPVCPRHVRASACGSQEIQHLSAAMRTRADKDSNGSKGSQEIYRYACASACRSLEIHHLSAAMRAGVEKKQQQTALVRT